MSRSVARVVATTVLLGVVYAFLPVPTRTDAEIVIRLAVGVLVFGAVIGWQLHSMTRADHPRLRAAEALAVAFALLVLGFAYTYLSLSHGDPPSFSQHLDRVGAVYYALTVVTTAGFGDIAARTDASRLVVIAQFIVDLLFVFGIVRVYFGAAEVILRRRQPDSPGPT